MARVKYTRMYCFANIICLKQLYMSNGKSVSTRTCGNCMLPEFSAITPNAPLDKRTLEQSRGQYICQGPFLWQKSQLFFPKKSERQD